MSTLKLIGHAVPPSEPDHSGVDWTPDVKSVLA